eukprot:scaffold13973_cov43-Cyclotella_meneghiniana.AAC.5
MEGICLGEVEDTIVRDRELRKMFVMEYLKQIISELSPLHFLLPGRYDKTESMKLPITGKYLSLKLNNEESVSGISDDWGYPSTNFYPAAQEKPQLADRHTVDCGGQGLLIVKQSSACMPVADWQSSHQRDACLSTPVVAGEKRGEYPPVDCDCQCRACLRLQSQARNEAPARLSTVTV